MGSDIAFIINPNANRGRSDAAIQRLQNEVSTNDSVGIYFTEYPNHAKEIVSQVFELGCRTVVAVGGDGTVHEVVNGLMLIPKEVRPSLGVIPLGSGNDFAFGSNLSQYFDRSLAQIWQQNTIGVDIGRVTDNHGKTSYWDNTLGIGFDAHVTARSRQITRVHGTAMYIAATLQTIVQNHIPMSLNIQVDDSSITLNTLMLTLANGPREGGGFLISPHSNPKDGVFEYVSIRDMSRIRMLALLPKVLRGTHLDHPMVSTGTFSTLRISSTAPFPVHCDGELLTNDGYLINELTIGIEPNAIALLTFNKTS